MIIIQVPNWENKVIVKIDELLESFIGIRDPELGKFHSIISCNKLYYNKMKSLDLNTLFWCIVTVIYSQYLTGQILVELFKHFSNFINFSLQQTLYWTLERI